MKIAVLGGTGMLGYEVFRTCLKRKLEVAAVVRNKRLLIDRIGKQHEDAVYQIDDAKNIIAIEKVLSLVRPDFVINCIGIIKQSILANNYYESVAINAFLPHQLERLGEKYSFRLIQISTDCVFDGKKGNYIETDLPNAYDFYGKSKNLGEVGYGKGITLRTSIIGHEITKNTNGLLEWFLGQDLKTKGYVKAIFSGLTTLELTRVILDITIPQNIPSDLYHVAAEPITKYDLLKIVAEVYNKRIDIEPSDTLIIDRSLNASKFAALTGYTAPSWKELIEQMYFDYKNGF